MEHTAPHSLAFMKMHGAGNDFVIIDARVHDVDVPSSLITRLSDRHFGIGFDQMAIINHGQDLRVAFFNADGSASAACGNATRCIAAYEMTRIQRDCLKIEVAGKDTLTARRDHSGAVHVNMGQPLTHWRDIPLVREMDSLHLPLPGDPVGTSMGNPHCTFFVSDAKDIDLARLGPEIETNPLFPERTNVQFASVIDTRTIRMRVWERGTGITLASGSSSCATLVAAVRRGLIGPSATVLLDGGALDIEWREDGVWMSGPTAHIFDGVLSRDFLASL